MKTPAAPARASDRAAPDSVFGIEQLLACRRSEGFYEDLPEPAPLLPVREAEARSAQPAGRSRAFALRLSALGR